MRQEVGAGAADNPLRPDPRLDLSRGGVQALLHAVVGRTYAALLVLAASRFVFLIKHGGSGVPEDLIRKAIGLGVAKLNINTEMSIAGVNAVRAFLSAKGNENTRLEELMVEARDAMVGVVKRYIEFLGSAGKA